MRPRRLISATLLALSVSSSTACTSDQPVESTTDVAVEAEDVTAQPPDASPPRLINRPVVRIYITPFAIAGVV